jgi:hypothetical protein
MRLIMIVIIFFIGLFAIILIIGRINLSFQFNKQVKQPFSETRSLSEKTFNHSQLLDLPEPVRRYFKHVLKEGQPYISYARITHDGQFKTGFEKDWIHIKKNNVAQKKSRLLFGKELPQCLLPGTLAFSI